MKSINPNLAPVKTRRGREPLRPLVGNAPLGTLNPMMPLPGREPFIRVPAHVVEMGIIKLLTSNELKVLVGLCYHENWRTGKCFPAWKTISQETGVGKNQLFKSFQHLKDFGLISIKRNRRRNAYQIFRTLQTPPGTVTVGREQSPRKLNRDKKGRLVTVARELTVTVGREVSVTVAKDYNERIERANRTNSKGGPSLTISKKTKKELEEAMGKEKFEAYKQAHGYAVDPAEENSPIGGDQSKPEEKPTPEEKGRP